jgi:integrase
MNEAIKQGFVISFKFDKIVKSEKTHRDFLTINELNLFLNADTKYNEIKNAFLFSCFTGLRISDLLKLTFNDIVNNEIILRQTKTNEPLRIPIPNNMIDFINSKRETNINNIFDLPKGLTNINQYIKQIAKQVGITKNISFHTSRHTFAVLLISQGIDIYTVSKLLGHTDIKTTQIYADIVSESKLNAIEKINNLNFIKLLNK